MSCFAFSKASLPIYLWMSVFRTIYDNIISKDQKYVQLMEKYYFKKKKKIDFKTLFYHHIVSTFRIYSIVKFRFSLPFIDSMAFTFEKRQNLHLFSLFYRNCSYPTWTACLCSPLRSFLLCELFWPIKQNIMSFSSIEIKRPLPAPVCSVS